MNSNDSITVSKTAVRRIGYFIGGIVVAVLVIVLAVFVIQSLSSKDALASEVNSQDYQAVFLTSSEVYFGKLSVPSGNFVILRHVYRLSTQASKSGKPLQRTLVKLVNDIHSPLDEMVINRGDILYVENLNPNGSAARLMSQGGS